MESREERAPRERLAHVMGLPVTDPIGMTLGVVVGRVLTGATIDLLVRRRRLFHRSRYLHLQGAGITVSGRTLVYHRPAERGSVRLEVLRGTLGNHSTGDAA